MKKGSVTTALGGCHESTPSGFRYLKGGVTDMKDPVRVRTVRGIKISDQTKKD